MVQNSLTIFLSWVGSFRNVDFQLGKKYIESKTFRWVRWNIQWTPEPRDESPILFPTSKTWDTSSHSLLKWRLMLQGFFFFFFFWSHGESLQGVFSLFFYKHKPTILHRWDLIHVLLQNLSPVLCLFLPNRYLNLLPAPPQKKVTLI